MATLSTPVPASPSETLSRTERPASSLRFDMLVATASLFFLFGLFLDGWAHNHGMVDDSFFTRWHLVFYSGYFIAGGILAVTQFRNVNKGYAFTKALPQGYTLALVGVALFGLGGAGDMMWHTIFGIEVNIEALMSPTHLMLAGGMFLFFTGPVLSTWARRELNPQWRELLPAIIALACLLSMMTFMLQYIHFMADPYQLIDRPGSNRDLYDSQAVANILLSCSIMIAVVLFALKRWLLPFGAVTIMFLINIILMTWMRSWNGDADIKLAIPLIASGLLADILMTTLKPSANRPNMIRVLAFAVPFVMSLGFLFVLNSINARGLWWEVHMWLGLPFMCGIAGVLLSILIFPPTIPQDI